MRTTLGIFAAVLFASCVAHDPLRPPATSTPPPVPPRPERTARVSGTVVDTRGEAVAGADITVTIGDADCGPSSTKFQTVSGAAGTFSLETDIGMGADESRCVFVTALAGGVSDSADARALFSNPPRDEARVRLQLPRPAPLTRVEADRVVDLFRRTLHAHDPALFRELGTYRQTSDSLISGLNDISSALRGITTTEMIDPYSYRLTGRTGEQITLRIEQDALTRVQSDVLDISPRAHTLMRHLADVIRKGDAERLAAVAATDVARARDIIERYRAAGNLEQPEFRLRTIDEAGHRLVYAFGDQRIELGYDEASVWVRSL